jgi:hypothetical protein
MITAPDDPADEGVRRGRRDAAPPGQEVPEDPAEQPGQDDRGRDRIGVDDVLGDRRGHLQ